MSGSNSSSFTSRRKRNAIVEKEAKETQVIASSFTSHVKKISEKNNKRSASLSPERKNNEEENENRRPHRNKTGKILNADMSFVINGKKKSLKDWVYEWSEIFSNNPIQHQNKASNMYNVDVALHRPGKSNTCSGEGVYYSGIKKVEKYDKKEKKKVTIDMTVNEFRSYRFTKGERKYVLRNEDKENSDEENNSICKCKDIFYGKGGGGDGHAEIRAIAEALNKEDIKKDLPKNPHILKEENFVLYCTVEVCCRCATVLGGLGIKAGIEQISDSATPRMLSGMGQTDYSWGKGEVVLDLLATRTLTRLIDYGNLCTEQENEEGKKIKCAPDIREYKDSMKHVLKSIIGEMSNNK